MAKGHSQNYTFPGVDVGLPSKVRGSEAEEEWQEVDWVTWSTGELSVDGDSFLLVFKPTEKAVKAKSLGALIRASLVEQDEDRRTLVVTTSDAVNKLYRLTFQSTQHAGEFSQLAGRAEASASPAAKTENRQREADEAEARLRLVAEVRRVLAIGRPAGAPAPLVFGGAELYGPDPNFEGGSEVLLGRGAVALLDPADEKIVGSYEMIFYGEDEGAREPVKRVAIAPKMALRRVPVEAKASSDGPAVAFHLALVPKEHTLAFDDAGDGEAFARDYLVRQRVMELAGKTVSKARNLDALRGELVELKQRGFFSRLQRLAVFLVVLSLVSAVARVAWLYHKDKGSRPPALYAQALFDETQDVLRVSGAFASEVASKACAATTNCVPAGHIRRCLRKKEHTGRVVRECFEALVAGLDDPDA